MRKRGRVPQFFSHQVPYVRSEVILNIPTPATSQLNATTPRQTPYQMEQKSWSNHPALIPSHRIVKNEMVWFSSLGFNTVHFIAVGNLTHSNILPSSFSPHFGIFSSHLISLWSSLPLWFPLAVQRPHFFFQLSEGSKQFSKIELLLLSAHLSHQDKVSFLMFHSSSFFNRSSWVFSLFIHLQNKRDISRFHLASNKMCRFPLVLPLFIGNQLNPLHKAITLGRLRVIYFIKTSAQRPRSGSQAFF